MIYNKTNKARVKKTIDALDKSLDRLHDARGALPRTGFEDMVRQIQTAEKTVEGLIRTMRELGKSAPPPAAEEGQQLDIEDAPTTGGYTESTDHGAVATNPRWSRG